MTLQKPLVLIAFKAPDDSIRKLRNRFAGQYDFFSSNNKEEALAVAERAEVLVMLNASSDVISRARKCKWIQTMTAGVEDFLALNEIKKRRDLLITNVSGLHGISISEHVFGLVLAFTRGIKTMIEAQKEGLWVQQRLREERRFSELYGKTIGIVGAGSIGIEIAKRAKAFGMMVLGVKREKSKSLKEVSYSGFIDEIFSTNEVDEVLSRSDVVVNALPITTETKDLFDYDKFSKAKKGSIFINIGRGQTVVQTALVDALQSGRIFAAGLDVFDTEPLPSDSPLWRLENVIISPHVAGNAPSYFERGLEIFAENLERYGKGEPLKNLVDSKAGY